MASFLYAVQDHNGQEIVRAHVDVQKVSDVHAEIVEGSLELRFEDVVIESADVRPHVNSKSYTLLRWPSDDKLATPVRHRVR